jgi:hypothetical protein
MVGKPMNRRSILRWLKLSWITEETAATAIDEANRLADRGRMCRETVGELWAGTGKTEYTTPLTWLALRGIINGLGLAAERRDK